MLLKSTMYQEPTGKRFVGITGIIGGGRIIPFSHTRTHTHTHTLNRVRNELLQVRIIMPFGKITWVVKTYFIRGITDFYYQLYNQLWFTSAHPHITSVFQKYEALFCLKYNSSSNIGLDIGKFTSWNNIYFKYFRKYLEIYLRPINFKWSNRTGTHNQLVCKRKLSHLAKLVE